MTGPHDTNERFGLYWAALGEFVHFYARLEYAMLRSLTLYTRTPDNTAKVLFSGTRTRAAIDLVRRASAEYATPLPAEIEEAFGRISIITTARDRILHLGIEIDNDDEPAFVSDERRNTAARAKREKISVEDIKCLRSDTITCWSRLVVFNHSLTKRPNPSQKAWEAAALRPWRYKPSQPSRVKPTHQSHQNK